MIGSRSRGCGYVGSLPFGLSTYPQPILCRPSDGRIAEHGDTFI